MKFSVFYAPPTRETIEKILDHLRKKTPFFPISPREPKLPIPAPPPHGIATCLMTSGTTGAPKFAMHTFQNHYANANNPHPLLKLTSSDRWRLSLPLNHVGGLAILFRCFVSGAEIAFDDDATHISMVPTQLKRYLQNPKQHPKLKAILLGGAPIPLELCNEAYRRGLPLFITYGMTEMSSQICTAPFHPKTGVTFGNPLPERELKIAPDGEIWVRGKTLFAGYLNRESCFIDGWFPTRDLGKMSPHGLTISGRKDRMMISGGENIHPEEIEQCLMNIPEVLSAKVTSRKDDEFGERPVAHITVSKPLKPEELREQLSQELPRFKIPYVEDVISVMI